MINQQLVNFIKQQLQVGIIKEKITSDLLANGWTHQDIEEGFDVTKTQQQTFQPQPSITKIDNHFGKKIFWIVLILFLLIAGVSVYYLKDDLLDSSIIKNLFVNRDTTVLSETPTQDNNIQTTTPAEQQNNIIPNTQEIKVTDPSLSVYNDINGLYSFSYPAGAEIDKQQTNSLYDLALLTIRQWDDYPIISIITDVNDIMLNKYSIEKYSPKNSFEDINTHPSYKYIYLQKELPNIYTFIYVIDLGTYNNTKLSIIFNVISKTNDKNRIDQIEKIIKSFIINKNSIPSAIKTLLAKSNKTQDYLKDATIKEPLSSTRASAEIYYEKSNSYYGFCKSNEYLNAIKSITKLTTLNCKDSKDTYSIIAPISDGYWCINETGYAGNTASKTICPPLQ